MNKRKFSQVHGPRGLPILGNLLQFDLNQLPAELERRVAEFGNLYRIDLLGKKFLVIAELELIHEVLRHRPVKFRRWGGIESVFSELGTNGLFSAEGDSWRRHRSLTAPAFNVAHLRQFFATMTTIGERLLARWDEPASRGADVEVLQDLTRFTIDVTTALAFGYDMNTLQDEGTVIQRHLEQILPNISRRLNLPFPYWRYFKLPVDLRLDRALAEVRKSIDAMIQTCRDRLVNNPALRERPTNLLEALLAAERNLSNDELFGTMITILVAGEDTTANTLAWILHHLVEYPDVQAKVRAEVQAAMGDRLRLNSYQDLEQLTYTEAVMNESMRFQPVSPILLMDACLDVELAGVQVPEGTGIILLGRACAMREENFSQPGEFRPERWIESLRNPEMNHNTRSFFPFGGGSRICPGRALAITEIKEVVAAIVNRFVLSKPKNGLVPSEIFKFVATPCNLWVNFRPL